MDNPNFTSYVAEELILAMTAEKNLILVDGHVSHVFNLSFICAYKSSDKNIGIACLPSG